ncbi:MAG: type II secretion system protein GspC [Woeseiaceae bacterium]|nr:type II secretion system protein GspC [Woeseiaceae bacterium]
MISKANWTDFSNVDGGNALATVNRVLPPWVSLLLVIAIGWQIARVIWMLIPVPTVDEPINVPVNLPAAAAPSGSGADVQTIAANHMFGVASEDDAAVPLELIPDDNLSDTQRTNLVLKGTIASAIKEYSVAVIADGNAEQKVYIIGDRVMSGVTLHDVYADRVVLNENGALTNLRLPSDFPAASAPVRRATASTRQAGRPNPNSLQNVVTQNLTKLTDVIRPTPYLVNGQQAGYRVYPGRNREQFAALGLRPGDLIKDIEGQSLTDPSQAMQIFQSLGTAEQVSVTIERNGQPQTIVLKTSQLDLDGEQTK